MADRITQAEAAVVAGCSVRTIARAITAGDLSAAHKYGHVLIDPSDLQTWIAARAAGHSKTDQAAKDELLAALKKFTADRLSEPP